MKAAERDKSDRRASNVGQATGAQTTGAGRGEGEQSKVEIPELSPDEWIKIFNLLLKQFGGRTKLGTLLSQKGNFFRGLTYAQAAAWLRHSNRFLTFEKDEKILFVQTNFKEARSCFKYKKHNTDRCENSNCPFFHVCREYLVGWCSRQPHCHFSHSFHARSNAKVCGKVGLQAFTDEEIRTIVLRSTPVVCNRFNKSGCKEDCPDLHVCVQFIRNNCSDRECRFGHTIKGLEHNDWVLETFHMQNIQENTMLKLVLTIREEPGATKTIPSASEGAGASAEAPRKVSEREGAMKRTVSKENTASSVPRLSTAEEQNKRSPLTTTTTQRGRKPGTPEDHTASSNDFPMGQPTAHASYPKDQTQREVHFDTRNLHSIPEKRREGLDSAHLADSHVSRPTAENYRQGPDRAEPKQRAPYVLRGSRAAARAAGIEDPEAEEGGQASRAASDYTYLCEYHTWTASCDKGYLCPRYHHRDRPPLVWQLQLRDQWLDFSQQDSADIERFYCRLHASAEFEVVVDGVGGLQVRVDFGSMTGTLLSGLGHSLSRNEQTLQLRRWSTPSYVEAESNTPPIFYTQWIWYQQVQGQLYEPLIPGSLQYTVEKKFLAGQAKYYYEAGNERLLLLLQKMRMVNLTQYTSVPVMRRPYLPHNAINSHGLPSLSPLLLTEAPQACPGVPASWGVVDCHQDFELVELESGSPEEVDVTGPFHATLSRDRVSVERVFRIQNPGLWGKYCSMKRSMTPRGGLPEDVDERRLFHGTPTLHAARSICANSMDFRLAGDNVGAKYGRGSYFSSHAVYSHCYTQGPERCMFLAKVLVGHFTLGKPEFKTPPVREGLKLFNSCVDNESNPSIFVIFDLAQSYPEYLIIYGDAPAGAGRAPAAADGWGWSQGGV